MNTIRRKRMWVLSILLAFGAMSLGVFEPLSAQGQGAIRLEGISVEYRRNLVRVVVRSARNWDFSRLIVLIDSDDNPNTGFLSTYRPGLGFDLLIQGVTLHRFNSRQRDQWKWTVLGEAKRHATRRRVIFDLDAKLFKSENPRVVAMAMSEDWQTALDIVPREYLTLPAPEPAPEAEPAPKVEPTPSEPPAPIASPRDVAAPVRHRIRGVRHFACYYGEGRVDDLARYDLAILHPRSQSAANIAELKKRGTIVIGYLSVGEDDVLRLGDGKGPGQYASWYFDQDQDDRPDRNVIWKSYYANADTPAWREDRIARARELVNGFGFQGLFLDTLDTVDLYPKSREGMIELVRDLRREFPHAAIILNNGFSILAKLAPMCDGLMIESFTCTYDRDRQSYFERNTRAQQWLNKTVEEKVRPMVTRFKFPVLALDYCRPDQTDLIRKGAQRAHNFGFLHSVAPYKLDQLYDISSGVGADASAKGGTLEK